MVVRVRSYRYAKSKHVCCNSRKPFSRLLPQQLDGKIPPATLFPSARSLSATSCHKTKSAAKVATLRYSLKDLMRRLKGPTGPQRSCCVCGRFAKNGRGYHYCSCPRIGYIMVIYLGCMKRTGAQCIKTVLVNILACSAPGIFTSENLASRNGETPHKLAKPARREVLVRSALLYSLSIASVATVMMFSGML